MDTTKIVSDFAQTIGQTLDILSARFGATGAHLWQVMCSYEYGKAVGAFTTAIFAVIIFIFFAWFTWRYDFVDDQREPTVTGFIHIICWVGAVASIATVLTMMSGWIATIISPEGAVLHMLMNR